MTAVKRVGAAAEPAETRNYAEHVAMSVPADINQGLVLVAAGAASVRPYLEMAAETRRLLDGWTGQLVARARAEGMSWAAIAQALGVTRQAVAQRYGPAAT